MSKLQDIKDQLFSEYLKNIEDISEGFYGLREAEISTENFSFYTSVSSVFSSKIEGEEMELDSFIKHKAMNVAFQPDYTKKIDDLYDAYLFAQNHELTSENLFQAHRILTQNILQKNQQGVLRTGNMFVMTEEGKIKYVAVAPQQLKGEMKRFFDDLKRLLNEKMTIEEVFFYASLLHLVFVKIHPMNDGNGRLARLLEKWFIAEKLGEKAWFLESEKMYHEYHNEYYQNIRKLGLEYEDLDYSNALDFLLMLPNVFKLKN